VLRGGHTTLFVPLASIQTHANAGNRKHKYKQRSFSLLGSKIQVWWTLTSKFISWED